MPRYCPRSPIFQCTKANKKQFARPIRDSLTNGRKRYRRVNRVVCAGLKGTFTRSWIPPIVLNTDLTTTACTRIPRVLFRTLNYSNVETACMRVRRSIERSGEGRGRWRRTEEIEETRKLVRYFLINYAGQVDSLRVSNEVCIMYVASWIWRK